MIDNWKSCCWEDITADWNYNPSVTTTTSTNPKITIDKDGVKGNGFSISGNNIKIDSTVTTSSKLNLGGEEITADDIKFIHELNQQQIMDSLNEAIELLKEKRIEEYKKEKEKDNMDMMKNFNFGPCGDRGARISHLGIAVQNNNSEWVSYDKENNEIVNVDLINFDCDNFVYMMPVAIKDVTEGDAIIHNRHVMFVTKVKGKTISVIDVTDGEIKKILPTKSIFGFDFITKIVSLVDFTASTADEDNPFGNMLPFLLLGNNNGKSNDTLPLVLMLMNKENSGGLPSFSPSSMQMMLMAMLMNGQNGDSVQNFLPLMFLMNENTKTATS